MSFAILVLNFAVLSFFVDFVLKWLDISIISGVSCHVVMFSFFHSVVLVYYIVGGLQNKRALPDILNLIEIKWNLLDNWIVVQKNIYHWNIFFSQIDFDFLIIIIGQSDCSKFGYNVCTLFSGKKPVLTIMLRTSNKEAIVTDIGYKYWYALMIFRLVWLVKSSIHLRFLKFTLDFKY